VLTDGGAKVWAICLRCEKRGGRSLSGGWSLVLFWIALPLVGLAVLTVLLELAFR
jgi:hypothetical protein